MPRLDPPITTLAAAVADATFDLEFEADWTVSAPALLALPGIGPWTAGYVALRGLGDPDAFPGTDLGIRYALVDLGVPGHGRTISALAVAILLTTPPAPVDPPRTAADKSTAYRLHILHMQR
jgi:hypothetical protein